MFACKQRNESAFIHFFTAVSYRMDKVNCQQFNISVILAVLIWFTIERRLVFRTAEVAAAFSLEKIGNWNLKWKFRLNYALKNRKPPIFCAHLKIDSKQIAIKSTVIDCMEMIVGRFFFSFSKSIQSNWLNFDRIIDCARLKIELRYNAHFP